MTTLPVSLERSHALSLDIADPLARQRNKFHLPITHAGNPQLYFCGHSLGLQPKTAAGLISEELQVWQHQAVEGHFAAPRPWARFHELLTPGLAMLVGAKDQEVVAMNSLTVNLHLMLVSFFRPQGRRTKILLEAQAFPSDRYAVCAQLAYHGLDPAEHLLEAQPRAGERNLRTEDLLALIDAHRDDLALVLLPGVQYLTGQLFDLPTLSRAVKQHGICIGLDLAHAIGNVPLHLHDWEVDFAVWCSYKYLNAGPGAIGGCFVHERHARGTDQPRFAGWWGHDKASRFAMPAQFQPIPGAEGWQLSNPPILACAPLLASLQIFASTSMAALRAKSVQLSGYLLALLQATLPDEVTLISPLSAAERGAQVSVQLQRPREQAKELHRQLQARGFICDWREPDVLRLAPVPLYSRYIDVWELVMALQALLRSAP